MKKTKVVATMGLVSESLESIEKMILAGVNVFRLNTKHGNFEWHANAIEKIQKVRKKLNKDVAILLDFQGPEVRIAKLPIDPFVLKTGDKFWFVSPKSDKEGIVLDHPEVVNKIKTGGKVFADDGFFQFKVTKVEGKDFEVEVIDGGDLGSRKTVNFPGILFDFPCLSEKDLSLMGLVSKYNIDYVGLSFVRSEEDIDIMREELNKIGAKCGIVAKIEQPSAIENFDKILAKVEAIMVARGDLGVEYPIEEVPVIQKEMVKACRLAGKPVIVATQMLDSMIKNPRPTRAEVSDIANTVYDQADAIMLSGETASGKYPLKSVEMMVAVATKTEEAISKSLESIEKQENNQTEAIVAAAYQMAEAFKEKNERISAFIVLTQTGATVKLLSKLRPNYPIFALSDSIETLGKLELVWGVKPVHYKYKKGKLTDTYEVLQELNKRRYLNKGQKVIIIYGERWGQVGQTSVVRIQEV